MIITPALVILLIIVFTLLYLFLKTVDKRTWLVAIISLVLTPVVYFYMFYPLINIFSNYHHQKYFNSALWIEQPNLRYEMIDYTISSGTLIGKNKDKINTLLGKAEWLSWDEEKKGHNNNKWNYSLGIEPGAFNTNKDCIEILFVDDKVKKIRTYSEEINYDDEE